jgi:hypothetical protein
MVALYCQHPNQPTPPKARFVEKHQKNTEKIPLPALSQLRLYFTPKSFSN